MLAVDTVGLADIAKQEPRKEETIFWFASQTKPMTALAVMLLVDDGKLKLDDPVEKYLPEFRRQMVVAEKDSEHQLRKKPGHSITIREGLARGRK